jgi:valyl-tRNA synthetase
MNKPEMASQYNPSEVETRWYQKWRELGLFRAEDESSKPSFSISMPPPNVTGSLHMGHALTATLQDILIRWKRMQGYNALWLPGTDHAGIATQMVVERELAKEGISRFDLGRDAFVDKIWEWKHHYHARISEQHTRLGISCDWDRERFTLDEGLSKAVREVFVQLYDDGLIYRSERLVNWSPTMHTVLSDLEVEAIDEEGSLWHMAYPVADSDETLVVATTRPETMLGDTAVAVHPDDDRYKHLVGKSVRLPLTDREIPIIADDILVDMEFGTGCVKVTPAHDFNDFETGRRHNLPMINILDKDAHLNENVPEQYQGLDRFVARKQVVADLEAAGAMVKVEPHAMSIGRSQRSGEIVEPMLSKQWFVKADVLAKEAIRVVEDGEIQIIPEHWSKTYFHWMHNIRDWCISRQLWWGHRIPAWYCDDCEEVTVSRSDAEQCASCHSTNIRQDDDVLDTWFSSALWPFSTLGWPEKTPALRTFYPNSVMETGHDILFFWVARMIMMGCHFMKELPFKTVYLHAMVRDERGQKMSKTKGNVVDPLELIDEFGCDALRFSLAALTVAGRSIKLSKDRVAGYRNFSNKIWNASRFALMNLEDYTPGPAPSTLSPPDQWILSKLQSASEKMNKELEAFDFGAAANTVYHFFWHELCDWYIELAKVNFQGEERAATQHTLCTVLDGALRLLHPIMPHLTEEIWQRLPLEETQGEAVTLMAQSYALPSLDHGGTGADSFDEVIQIITDIRTIRGENEIPPSKRIHAILNVDGETESLHAAQQYIVALGRLESFDITTGTEVPEGSAVARSGRVEVIVPLEGLVDFDEERRRLTKLLAKLDEEIGRVDKKLNNPNFVQRAPEAVVEKERGKLAALQAERTTLEQGLAQLPSGS